MNKSEHLVTVPRDYLEALEKFKEENTSGMNAKISYVRIPHAEKDTCLLTLDNIEAERVRDSSRLVIVDLEGREKHVLYNYL